MGRIFTTVITGKEVVHPNRHAHAIASGSIITRTSRSHNFVGRRAQEPGSQPSTHSLHEELRDVRKWRFGSAAAIPASWAEVRGAKVAAVVVYHSI